MKYFRQKLNELESKGRLRSLNLPRGIDFTSNDYLGLRAHPELRRAAIAALESGLDIGAGGSRLLRGNHPAHEELEEFAAHYFGAEKALFFATGYQANMAIFTALPERGDTIIFDANIHASAREGIQASLAAHRRVAHNDLDAFEKALKAAKGQRWIAVESVYSMDGDVAPLKELLGLAQKYDAILIVDEAHGTGVFGESGKGLSENCFIPHPVRLPEGRGDDKIPLSLQGEGGEVKAEPGEGRRYPDNLITLHTGGKALGVAGGLVCAGADIIDTMINKARPFIYSTAPMPLQAVLVKRALELVQEEPERRQALHKLMHFAASIDFLGGLFANHFSSILPVIIGDDAGAVAIAGDLQQMGFDVRAIRPPSVPEGSARLRISLSANITERNLRDLSAALMPHLMQEAA